MSYQVLARKWRPTTFEEVVGQDHVVKALSNALTLEKIHHAYLLSGTRGVGKTTIARILTKSLNCETGLTAKPCNTCESCLGISSGNSIDFQEVDAASRRGVEETQQLLETVAHMPGSARYKVYLIDEVHMLTKHSFNVLLKTLEEPPPKVIFILATTAPENIPATVLSRCLKFHLKNLPPKILGDQLEYILKKEKIAFDQGSISQIARSGKGSLRDCLTLLDQAIVYCNNNLTNHKISKMLGTLPYDEVYSLTEFVILRNSIDLFKKLQEISELSVDYRRLLDLVLEAIQSLVIAQIEPDALVNILVDKDNILALSSKISAEDAQVLYQIGLMTRKDLDFAPDLSSGFEMALIRMMLFMPKTKQEETERKEEKGSIIETEETQIEENNKISPVPAKSSFVNNEIIHKKQQDLLDDTPNILKPDHDDLFNTPSDLTEEAWYEIFRSLDLAPGTKQLISHCSFLRKEGLVVYFSMPELKLSLLTGKHRKEFQELLSGKLKQDINIFYEPTLKAETSPNAIKEKDAIRKKIDLENSINNDPNIKLIKKEFDASVIDSSIKEVK